MTNLSVNINKLALLRNSRPGEHPNLLDFVTRLETHPIVGITVHPRPDERHVRYRDLLPLKSVIRGEFNIEGYPSQALLQRVLSLKPTQMTLVPDRIDVLTSDSGWVPGFDDELLKHVCTKLNAAKIRVSLFIEANTEHVRFAAESGVDAVELYTGEYAKACDTNNLTRVEDELMKHQSAAECARTLGLRVHAGHDLNLQNLGRYLQMCAPVDEVSIGHALTVDMLRFGLDSCLEHYCLLVSGCNPE